MCGMLIAMNKGVAQTLGGSQLATYTIGAGTTIVLHGGTPGAAAYQWSKDGVKIPGAVNKDYTTGIAGTYTVTAYNAEGCESAISDGVIVVVTTFGPPPTSPIKILDTLVDLAISITSSNIKAQQGQSYDYTLTANNNSSITGTQVQVTYIIPPQLAYDPQFGTNSASVNYDPATRTLTWLVGRLTQDKPQTLVVPVKVLQPGTIQSTVDISGKQRDPILANNMAQVVQQVNPLIIPNVFTPNGDGVNDYFFIPGLDTYSENEITIINRWGNVVYEKKNYQGDWTGNGLPEGTYYYVLRAFTLAGVWDVYKGYVTLLRTRTE